MCEGTYAGMTKFQSSSFFQSMTGQNLKVMMSLVEKSVADPYFVLPAYAPTSVL